MSPPPPPAPLPQTLADLATKQHEDHEAVVATLNSLSEENHTARTERAEDRATLVHRRDTQNPPGPAGGHVTAAARAEPGPPSAGRQGHASIGWYRVPAAPRCAMPPSHTGAPADPGDRAPRLYKIDFPLFDGASDPRPWLTRCNLFFLGQRTPESDKTWLASYHLTDVAALWYGHLETKLGQRPS